MSARGPSVDRLGAEDGFHLAEASVAMGVITMAIVGVVGAMSLGMVAAGSGTQRSSAAALASERIERVRNVPFDEVALDEEPSHSTDPENPDNDVTQTTPPKYDVNGDGSLLEPFVLSGSVRHIEDPVVRGSTELYVYQYVTWVDDAGIAGTQDYKRVTVVVSWRRALNGGPSARVTMSTFMGSGTVTVPQSTPTPTSPSPSPTPSPAPEGGSSCEGDTTSPTGSVEIVSGSGAETGYTASTTVQVRVEAQDACADVDAELSNDGASFTNVGAVTPGVPTTFSWTVPGGDGGKTVSARFRDGAGNVSLVYTATTVLDQTAPSVPSSFSEVSCTISGSDRTIEFTWGASSDTNLSGYRLYRSIDSAEYAVVSTVATLSASDTAKKSFDTVRYLVRAYDKAGNESGDSVVLTYSKNSC